MIFYGKDKAREAQTSNEAGGSFPGITTRKECNIVEQHRGVQPMGWMTLLRENPPKRSIRWNSRDVAQNDVRVSRRCG
jgi:hypothetical protein